MLARAASGGLRLPSVKFIAKQADQSRALLLGECVATALCRRAVAAPRQSEAATSRVSLPGQSRLRQVQIALNAPKSCVVNDVTIAQIDDRFSFCV